MERRTIFWYAEFTPADPYQLLARHSQITSLWAALTADLEAVDAPGYPSLHDVAGDPYGGTVALATASDDDQVMALWYAQSLIIAVRRTALAVSEFDHYARWEQLVPAARADGVTTGACELTETSSPAPGEALDRFDLPGVGQLHFCAAPGERYLVRVETDGTPASYAAADDVVWYDSSRGLLGHGALLALELSALLRARRETTLRRDSLAGDLSRLEASVAELQARLSRAHDRRGIASHRESSTQLLGIVNQRARLLGNLSFLRLQLHECQQLRLNLATRLTHLGQTAPDTTWVIRLAQVVEREIGMQLHEFELNDSRLATAVESYQVVLDQQNYTTEQRRQVISAAQAAAFTVLALVLTLLQTVQAESEQVAATLWDLVSLLAFVGALSFAGVFLFLDRGVRYDRRHILAVFLVLLSGTGWLLRIALGHDGSGAAAGVVSGAPLLWWAAKAICRGVDLAVPALRRHTPLLRAGCVTLGAAGSATLGYWSTGLWGASLLCFLIFAGGSAGWLMRRSGP